MHIIIFFIKSTEFLHIHTKYGKGIFMKASGSSGKIIDSGYIITTRRSDEFRLLKPKFGGLFLDYLMFALAKITQIVKFSLRFCKIHST